MTLISAQIVLLLLPFAAVGVLYFAWPSISRRLLPKAEEELRLPSPLGAAGTLVLASAAALFTELMIIRVHGSYLQVLAFYKNVSLLSCFVGLGIGFSRSGLGARSLLTAFPFLCLQIALLYALRFTAFQWIMRNPSLEMGAMGMKRASTPALLAVVDLGLLLLFAANALAFIPLGNVIAWASRGIEPLRAYTLNLLGSLLGILAFLAASALMTPPSLWLAAAALLFVPLFGRSRLWVGSVLFSALVTASYIGAPLFPEETNWYSPYNQLTVRLERSRYPTILVNNFYFQRMFDLDSPGDRTVETHYSLPYLLRPAASKTLVMGSGSGNDVAGALRGTKGAIDAVEIDPLIYEFGRMFHPSDPYGSPRVTIRLDDGRAFLKGTSNRYDLIVYGLLDSHAAVQGALRLDSYIYTLEAIKEARARLTESGVLCLSFAVRKEEVVASRIYQMMRLAFDGREPYVHGTGYDAGILYCNSDAVDLLARGQEIGAPSMAPDFVDRTVEVSTDDWPFLYLAKRAFPPTYALLFALLLGAAWLLTRSFTERRPESRFGLRAFLLGAGFMLLETKAITELALVYGSTWMVTSFTIFAVLLMACLSNMVAARLPSLPDALPFGLLLASIAGTLVYSLGLLGTPGPGWAKLLNPLVLTFPLFFSGFCFSAEARRSEALGDTLYPNTLGAVLGGCLEYLSLQFGFHSLYFAAMGIYGLAYLSGPGGGKSASVPLSRKGS